MTQNSMYERKGQFQLYFPWYFLNTSHNVGGFFVAQFFRFKNRQGFGKCCLPLIKMGIAHNHSLNVLEQGISYVATKGAELGKTLIWHFSKPQLKRAVLLFLTFQMLIAAGYLSNALLKAFSKTKVLQQSTFTVQQMSWSLLILLGNMVLSSWWAIMVGSWPLMVITDPTSNFVKRCCQSNTDDSSLTPETLPAVSAGCSIFAVLGCDLQNIYKIFHFRASRTAAASRAECLSKDWCTHAPLEEQPLEGQWFTRRSLVQVGWCFGGFHRPLDPLCSTSAFCLLAPAPLLSGLPVTLAASSTERHDSGQEGDFRELLASRQPVLPYRVPHHTAPV